jgi:hypothetical protein
MMRFVGVQMETIDVPASTNHGFLFKLVKDLKKQDENSVQKLLTNGEEIAKSQPSPGMSRKGSRSSWKSSPSQQKKKVPSTENEQIEHRPRKLSASSLLKQKAPQAEFMASQSSSSLLAQKALQPKRLSAQPSANEDPVCDLTRSGNPSKRLSIALIDPPPLMSIGTEVELKRERLSANMTPPSRRLSVAMSDPPSLIQIDKQLSAPNSPNLMRKRGSSLVRKSQEVSASELATMIAPLAITSLDQILGALKLNGEIDLKDGFIFSRRGGAKIVQNLDLERRRRQSFTSTNFSDQDALLRAEKLKEMSDLNFLFSLNGYHLPYCESSKQRSMYEGFFAAFLREVHAGKPESHSFRVLQEAITALYITSELSVDFLECLFEIIGIVRSCSKIAVMGTSNESTRSPRGSQNVTKKLSPREAQVGNYKQLDKALDVFNDIRGVFPQFKSRKLLNSISGVKDGNTQATFLSKYNDYCDVIIAATDIHDASCGAFRAKMESLHDEIEAIRCGESCVREDGSVWVDESTKRNSSGINIQNSKSLPRELSDRELRRMAFCNDVIIYVESYRDFLRVFSTRGQRLLDLGREMILKLDSVEKSPRKRFVRSMSKIDAGSK